MYLSYTRNCVLKFRNEELFVFLHDLTIKIWYHCAATVHNVVNTAVELDLTGRDCPVTIDRRFGDQMNATRGLFGRSGETNLTRHGRCRRLTYRRINLYEFLWQAVERRPDVRNARHSGWLQCKMLRCYYDSYQTRDKSCFYRMELRLPGTLYRGCCNHHIIQRPLLWPLCVADAEIYFCHVSFFFFLLFLA